MKLFSNYNYSSFWFSLVCCALASCASPKLTNELDIRIDRASSPSIILARSIVPGDLVRQSNNGNYDWVTYFSDRNQLEEAARATPERSLLSKKSKTHRLAFTERQSEIYILVKSLGLKKEAGRSVSRITVECMETETWDIRDESILLDLLNRPYTYSGADDVVASNLNSQGMKLLICSSAATITDFNVTFRFNKAPTSDVQEYLKTNLNNWAANERIAIKNIPQYSELTQSIQVEFTGTVTIRARVYPLLRTQGGSIAIDHPYVLERAPFLISLLR